MARKTRLAVPGLPHHVTQRGNDRQAVFLSDDDRKRWLDLFFERCTQWQVEVHGYCLMTNHVHLVVTPARPDDLSGLMCRTQSDYARIFNLLRGRCGHLWHERFYCAPLAEMDAMRALAYIEMNPVRVGMVRHAVEYPWSSARAHVRGLDPEQRLSFGLWSRYSTPERWREVLSHGVTEEAWKEKFRRATLRNLPCAPESFIKELEQRTGRPLESPRRGRPPIVREAQPKAAAQADAFQALVEARHAFAETALHVPR